MPVDIVAKLPAPLRKRIGPLPAYAWIGAGAVGIGLVVYMKRHGGNPIDSLGGSGASEDVGTDEAGYPYAVGPPVFGDAGGGGGGGGGTSGGAGAPATPPPTPLPAAFRASANNCGPGYCWNGVFCIPKTYSGPCRSQPGASPAAPLGASYRKCPPDEVWNGYVCVPRVVPNAGRKGKVKTS